MASKQRSVLSDECIKALKDKKRDARLTWPVVAKDLEISEDMVYALLARRRGPGHHVALSLARYLSLDATLVAS